MDERIWGGLFVIKNTINMQDFLKQFKKEYNFLYDHYDNVAGYYEAVLPLMILLNCIEIL